jgi:hypothetical protein
VAAAGSAVGTRQSVAPQQAFQARVQPCRRVWVCGLRCAVCPCGSSPLSLSSSGKARQGHSPQRHSVLSDHNVHTPQARQCLSPTAAAPSRGAAQPDSVRHPTLQHLSGQRRLDLGIKAEPKSLNPKYPNPYPFSLKPVTRTDLAGSETEYPN